MPDIATMSAPELLAWLEEAPIGQTASGNYRLSLTRYAVAAGRWDTAWVEHLESAAAPAAAVAQLGHLTEYGRRRVSPTLTDAEFGVLGDVGHRVILEDRENTEEWAQVARALITNWPAWRDAWTPQARWRVLQAPANDTAANLIGELLDAGRGPTYGMDMIRRATAAKLPPDLYGWGVSPVEFSDFAAAGVQDDIDVTLYRAALDGLVPKGRVNVETITLANAGVTGLVAYAGRLKGVPRATWVEDLAGIPDDWLQRAWLRESAYDAETVEQKARRRIEETLGGQWSLQDLRRLVLAGWTKPEDNPISGVSWRTGSSRMGSDRLTPDQANLIAHAGLTLNDISRWMATLITGPAGRDTDRYPPAILKPRSGLQAGLPAILRLHQAGVRRAHIPNWRWAGARTADDILTAIRAGIDHTQADQMARDHGVYLGRYVSQGDRCAFRSINELLRAAGKGA